ncbi:hypothetical protein RhiirC2_797529, partial [Rhizophagus irregularis]
MFHPNASTPSSPNNNPTCTLPQHIIDDLQAQIKEIANTLSTLDETVSWMQDTITQHEYRLTELELMMSYDNPNDADTYSPPDNTKPYSQNVGWDNEPSYNTSSRSNFPPYTSSSLMDTSPDASFLAMDPNSVLSSRHVPLPNSRSIIPAPDATASRLQKEISNVTNGFHPPNSAIPNYNILNNPSSSPSPLINFGQINVNGLCSPIRQLHLLNYFLYSSFGVLSLNDTCLTSSSAKFIYQNEHSQYNFKSYWALSPSNSRPHDGVGLLLRHPLHKHVQKIDLWKERDAIFAQLNLWLDKAHSNNYHVVILGPSSTFYYQNGSSRLDYIPGFPAPGLFSHVETCPNSCFATLAKARLKQKSEQRTIFLYKNLNDDIWDKFSVEVNSRLEVYLSTHYPSISSLPVLPLDKLWHALKRSILGSAINSLPFQHVSNTHYHKYFPELTKLIAINKFLDRLLFKLTTSRTSRLAQITQMINSLPIQLILLKSLLTDYTIPIYSTTPLSAFVKKFLRSQKALVSAYLSMQFYQHRVDSIEYYTALRDEHFSTSPGSFISSALSVEHRSIVLDRVLV